MKPVLLLILMLALIPSPAYTSDDWSIKIEKDKVTASIMSTHGAWLSLWRKRDHPSLCYASLSINTMDYPKERETIQFLFLKNKLTTGDSYTTEIYDVVHLGNASHKYIFTRSHHVCSFIKLFKTQNLLLVDIGQRPTIELSLKNSSTVIQQMMNHKFK